MAVVNSGQNHNSKDSALNDGLYGYDNNELSYYGRISYEGDMNEISYLVGVAAGVQQNDDSNETNALNIFARVGTGPFELETEYMTGTVDTAGGDHDHQGYSIRVPISLNRKTKETGNLYIVTPSLKERAIRILVSAKEIIRRGNFTADGPTAWELVDEFEQHYFGINYLFNGHDIKFMLGYEMNELKDTEENGGSADMDGFRARMQFLF